MTLDEDNDDGNVEQQHVPAPLPEDPAAAASEGWS